MLHSEHNSRASTQLTREEIYKKAQKKHEEKEHDDFCLKVGMCPQDGADLQFASSSNYLSFWRCPECKQIYTFDEW